MLLLILAESKNLLNRRIDLELDLHRQISYSVRTNCTMPPSKATLAYTVAVLYLLGLVSRPVSAYVLAEQGAATPDQQVVAQLEPLEAAESTGTAWLVPQTNGPPKCNSRSLKLARQMLAHQFESINQYNSIWFNDLDLDEIRDGQKQSLANMFLMSEMMPKSQRESLIVDSRTNLPLIEIESSGFKPLSLASSASGLKLKPLIEAINNPSSHKQHQQISIKLLTDEEASIEEGHSCQVEEKGSILYTFGLSLGPFEHNLDVVYNLPKELRISQPIDWRYAQIKLIVPLMVYKVTLRQQADHKLAASKCPLEVAEVTYLGSSLNGGPRTRSGQPQVAILAAGMAATNQTISQLERLFGDYTRPSMSRRLRQVLRFHLNSKTLPLSLG